MFATLFVMLQYILPQHLITALIWRIARIRHQPTKNFLITQFVKIYKVDIDDVKLNVPEDFETFNDFFVTKITNIRTTLTTLENSIGDLRCPSLNSLLVPSTSKVLDFTPTTTEEITAIIKK